MIKELKLIVRRYLESYNEYRKNKKMFDKVIYHIRYFHRHRKDNFNEYYDFYIKPWEYLR